MMPITTFAGKTAAVFGLALTMGACGRATAPDANVICAANAARLESGDERPLFELLATALNVETGNIRVEKDGVFVPTWEFFVEKQAYWVANPGTKVPDSGDPSYTLIDSCLYHYRLAG